MAVIFAGGVGKRMKTNGTPKQFLRLYDKEIIIYTLELFQNNEKIDKIIISCLEEKIEYLKELIKKFNLTKVVSIVKGGNTGQESIYNALQSAKKESISEKDIVLIHDGVRPLILQKTIDDNIVMVETKGNSITVAPAVETVVNIKDDKVKKILSRNECFLARAPQSFYLRDILKCHEKAKLEKKEFIDSASLMDYYGNNLNIVEGPSENIKITTPIDFYIFKAILDAKRNIDVFGL
ncbi:MULTISPECIES: 2-C-methyl-D-erythritol 4-phosphate cytidylyltransferase [unclassified Fusobacterium]|nr:MULTISPECIES: IspD/TarI family cytidylyltransferase [unclassified Fusobacterium]